MKKNKRANSTNPKFKMKRARTYAGSIINTDEVMSKIKLNRFRMLKMDEPEVNKNSENKDNSKHSSHRYCKI